MLKNEKVEWKRLGEVCIRQKGTKITAELMKKLNKPGALVKIFAGGNTVAEVDIKDTGKENVIYRPSIIVKSRGNIDFEFYDGPFSHKNEMWSYATLDKKLLNIKYLYYFYQVINWNPSTGGTINRLYNYNLKNVKVVLPPLELQNKVVEILDKFQSLIADTKGLLPKEIEERKKQYEYYREKLLTFDIKPANVQSINKL